MLNRTMIFSLSANKKLAEDIANELDMKVSEAHVTHFADGEILCEPVESVREKDVYIVQSTYTPVTENLFEILVFVDACKRASSRKINVIIPYFGYARQDRKSKPRQPITSKLVADSFLYTLDTLSSAMVSAIDRASLVSPEKSNFVIATT